MHNKSFFLLLLTAFLLAACGAGGGLIPAASLKVDMVEFMFEPKNLTVAAGEEISLELSNNGAVEHNFVILKKGVTAEGNFEHDANLESILFEAKLGPGQTDTFTFTIPEAGEYQVICSIPGHLAAGMAGKLIVK
jgi:uncharacterized cupredoxin-like copper-binding protein